MAPWLVTGHAGGVEPDLPPPVSPMLATAGTPPAGPGWAFEFKWDGVRAVVAVAGPRWRATSRNGNDVTGGYPDLAGLSGAVDGRVTVLDGEIVALDGAGRPDFGLLQRRMHVRSPSAELRAQVPVSYYAFDVLVLDGEPVTALPYTERRELLEGLGLDGADPAVRVPQSVRDVAGAQLLDVARLHGLEGVVGKRCASRYDPGRRSAAWVKTALLTTQEVLIGGWRPGQGRRDRGVGSLLLGAHDGEGRLRYLGNVGTGFTDRMLADLLARLGPLARDRGPFEEIPREDARGARWVEPELVGEVEFRTWTHDGRLRHASWRGLRPDKDPDDVTVGPARPG